MSTGSFLEAQAAALWKWGVHAEERFVDVPSIGGRAHVLVTGEGPPVVMVNGIGLPAAMWAPLIAELSDVTLYAVDLPAYGLTDSIPGLAEDLRSSAVTFLREVLDGLALPRATFIANSLGSLWASWLAIDDPARVEALVHVGCPAVVLDTSAPFPMRVLGHRVFGPLIMKFDPPSAKQVRRLSKLVKEHPLPAEIADLLLATERLPDFPATFLTTLQTLIRPRGARPGIALTANQLSQIRQPSLLIFAADDPFGAADVGTRVARALPDAELHMVDGGHAPWIRHADQIAPLIARFVANRSEPYRAREEGHHGRTERVGRHHDEES